MLNLRSSRIGAFDLSCQMNSAGPPNEVRRTETLEIVRRRLIQRYTELMAELHPVTDGRNLPTFEGTWAELAPLLRDFGPTKLRVTVLTAGDQPENSNLSRLAIIDSVFGKYADLGISVDQLQAERGIDKAKEDGAWSAKMP